MRPEAIAAHIRERLEHKVLDASVAYDQLVLTVAPEAYPDAARLCKEDPALAFDFFEFLSGVDERDAGFSVITHLYSVAHRHHITLKTIAPGGRDKPVVPSISHVYGGVNWHERETYDMFGIEFEGHPGLLPRILTIENFEGWPLRKDFLLSTREAKPWPGAKEPGEPGKGEEAASDEATHAEPLPAEDKAAAAKAKAERAKAKAAEMRKKKAAERGASEYATVADTPQATPASRGEQIAEPDAEGERAAASAAAGAPVPDGTADPSDPVGAAAIADSGIAKDAAAGSVQGDAVAGAPGDASGADEPVDDPQQEAGAAEGAPAQPSAAPGVEAEGRHGGAVDQTTEDTPAEDEDGP